MYRHFLAGSSSNACFWMSSFSKTELEKSASAWVCLRRILEKARLGKHNWITFRTPQPERVQDANTSKLKYILIWKELVEQEVRWCSEIGWKCYETEVFLLGISSPPKKFVGVKKSNGNAVKYKFIYLEWVRRHVRRISEIPWKCCKTEVSYLGMSRRPGSSTEFKKLMEVIWNWNFLTWS